MYVGCGRPNKKRGRKKKNVIVDYTTGSARVGDKEA
jgi:hypothetical protein